MQWWCAIWNAMALVYCFLFMEETNYDRPARMIEDTTASPTGSEAANAQSASETDEKASNRATVEASTSTNTHDREMGQVLYPRKTYIQKLGIKDKPRPNRMVDIALGGLTGFSYPSVLYAGYANLQRLYNAYMLTFAQFDVWCQQLGVFGHTECHSWHCLYNHVWFLYSRCRCSIRWWPPRHFDWVQSFQSLPF